MLFGVDGLCHLWKAKFKTKRFFWILHFMTLIFWHIVCRVSLKTACKRIFFWQTLAKVWSNLKLIWRKVSFSSCLKAKVIVTCKSTVLEYQYMEKNLFFNSTGLCKSTRMLVPFSLSSEKWLGPSTGSATFLHWPLKIKTDYLVDYQVINVHMYTHLLVTKLGICYVTCPWNTYYFEIHLIYTAYILVALFELNLATAVHDIKLKV